MQDTNDLKAFIRRLDEKFAHVTVLTERTARISLFLCTSILAGSCLVISAVSIRARQERTIADSTEIIACTYASSVSVSYNESEEVTVYDVPEQNPEELNRSLVADVLTRGNYMNLSHASEEDDEEVSTEVINKTPPKNLSDRQVTRMLSGQTGQVRIIDRKDINEGAASSGSSEDTGNAQAESSAVSGSSGIATSASSNSNYVIGIDVSSWNGNINWKKVRDYGVKFVMIKCGGRYWGSGLLYKDKQFEANVKGARAAGIDVGVYFYSAATSVKEAYEEASYVVDLIKDYRITYPVAIDFEINSSEYRHANVKGKDLRDVLCTFCDTVKSQGYKPMVYMSKSCWTSVLGSSYASEVSSKYKVWLAVYYNRFIDGTEPFKIGDNLPSFNYKYDIWQYGYLKNVVPGISGSVDMNLSFMSSTALNTPVINIKNDGKLSISQGTGLTLTDSVTAVDSQGHNVDASAIKVAVTDAQGNAVTADKASSVPGTYTVRYSFMDAYYGTVSATASLTVTGQSAEPSAAAPSTDAAPTAASATTEAPVTAAPTSESVPSSATSDTSEVTDTTDESM